MKEEEIKTLVECPTIKVERADLNLSTTVIRKGHSIVPKLSTQTADIIDTQIFQEQQSSTSINLSEESISEESLEKHVNIDLVYDLGEAFAEGAQGSIHSAKDIHLKRIVAVKALKEHSMRRSFINEAQLTAQLDHPAIIPIYSLNSDENSGIYFSMKKVNGVTLNQYLTKVCDHYYFHGFNLKNEASSLVTRLEHFIKICEAVQYAHSKAVVHRDLKPDNIMIGESREVYVMDWGIAYCMDGPENQKPEVIERTKKIICGSPGYIDPQMVCNNTPAECTDIYSLGMILHEMCTLQRGFTGFSTNELFEQAVKGDFPEIKHRFSSGVISAELKAIIEKARAPELIFRYNSVEELCEDVRRLLRNDEVSSLPDKPLRKVMRWAQKNPHKITVIMISLIMSLSSLVIYSLFKQNQTIVEARIRENTFAQLQSHVAEKAHLIDSQMTKLEQLLSRVSASLLSMPTVRDETLKLYSSNDFSKPETKPPGTVYSSIFGKEVNVNTMVYKLAPEVKFNEVENILDYLFSFKDDFVKVMLKSKLNSPSHLSREQINPEQILMSPLPARWLYCGLENGVFVSFPGKGGYPAEYDHRNRPWYKDAKNRKGVYWAKPYYDINGLGIVLPCTIGLYNKENEFSGVLALDVTLDFLAKKLMLNDDEKRIVGLQESTILNPDGEIIITSSLLKSKEKNTEFNNQAIERRPYHNDLVLKAVQANKNTIIYVREGGQKVIYALNRIPALNWFYIEKYDAQKILKKKVN
ncbi:protein kinase [Lentisphaera profundi]|uniref:Protein kinase n=1 Tax=Lentisphaera profundi TaxID=1658616 RepID=A0ABY7VYB7_9BACT|nr:protein kinase [Lentisphaera profundi]WDE99261.1 protein kinase [Lentisphaera profundi]